MRTLKSKAVRAEWSTVLNEARNGATIAIELYNRPVARLVPYRDPQLGQLEHRLIEEGRRHAAAVRTGPLKFINEPLCALDATETALVDVVGHLGPWGTYEDHLAAVQVATRQHYLPTLMTALPATWHEADITWAEALHATCVDADRIRRLQALTHEEVVAACAYLGIDAPDPPISIEDRLAERDQAARQASIDRGEDPDDW